MSSSMRSGVTNSNSKFGKECMCGRGEECKGISAAFALLNDPRRGYVMVPNMIQHPTTQYMREMNGLREAYLRHLATDNAILDLCKDINVGEEDDGIPKFIALHHFHPTVVETHAEKAEIEAARRNRKSKGPKIPRTLKPVDVKFLQIEGLTDQDRVRDEYNQLTDLFYFVPNYPMAFVKEDLKKAIRVSRLMSADVGSTRSSRSRSSSRRSSSRHRHSGQLTVSSREQPVNRAMFPGSHDRNYSLTRDSMSSRSILNQHGDAAAVAASAAIASSVGTSVKSGRESKKKKKKRGRSKPAKQRRKSSKRADATKDAEDGKDLRGRAASGRSKSKSRRSLSRGHKPWQESDRAEGGPTHDDLEELEPTRAAQQDDEIDRRVAEARSALAIPLPLPLEKTPIPVEKAPAPPPPIERPPASPPLVERSAPPPPPAERAAPPPPPPTAESGISPAGAVGIAAAGVAAGAVTTTQLFSGSHSSIVDDDDLSPPPPTTRTRPMVDEDEDRMQPKPGRRAISPVPQPTDDTTPPLKDEESEEPTDDVDEFFGEDTIVPPPPPPPESALNSDQILDTPTLGTSVGSPRAKMSVAALAAAKAKLTLALAEDVPVVDMTDDLRSEMYHNMLKFESRRRAQYADSMTRCESDWRACLEAMQAGIFETARAERSILGAALASQAYADAMRAICDDTYIDDDGDIVLNQMVRNRLSRARQKEEEANVETMLTSPTKEQRFMMSEPAAGFRLLEDLVDASADLASKFEENAGTVSEQVVIEMTDLRKQLKVQMLSVKKRGDTLVREMKRSEREVLIAWSAFDAIGGSQMEKQMANEVLPSAMQLDDGPLPDPLAAPKPLTTEDLEGSTHGRLPARHLTPMPIRPNSMHGAPSPRRARTPIPGRDGTPRRGGWTRKQKSFQIHQQETEATAAETQGRLGASPVTSSFRSLVSIRDVWIAEMFYKAAVNYEAHVWERCMGEMTRLYGTLQEIELERQFKVHQVLLDFMPRQRRLSLSLTPVMQPILNDLVNTRSFSESMEDIVEEAIRKLSEDKLKKDQGVRSKYMNRSRANIQFHQQDIDLEPPEGEIFDNGLLRGTKILERKTNVRQWRTSLCIVTADGTLHLMDLHLFPKFAAGHSADQAFGELLPKYTMPNDTTAEPEARVGTITKNLTPSVSVNLSKATCRTDPFDPTVLELSETFKGYFRDDATRKIYLRMTIREEAEQWKGLLLEFLSESALGESNHNNNRGSTPQLSTLKQAPAYDLSHGISYGDG